MPNQIERRGLLVVPSQRFFCLYQIVVKGDGVLRVIVYYIRLPKEIGVAE